MPEVPPPDGAPRRGSARQRSAAFRAAQQRAAQQRAADRARRRRRALIWAAAVVVAVSAAAITAAVRGGSGHASAQQPGATGVLTGPPGPEGIVLEQGRLLAPESTAAGGETVDGIRCDASEQVAYHIHAHLTVYVNGALRPIPAGIGIVTPVAEQTPDGPFYSATRCYYWLHVHAQDGVIHVESPDNSNYTLGQFFAIWKQPLTADRIGPDTGTLTVFVNGVRRSGNPATIELESHEDIQIDVGTPVVAPQRIDWSKSQL